MQRRLLAVLVVLGLSLPFVAAASDPVQCFTDRRVTEVATGMVELAYGSDGGDAIYFWLDDGRYYPIDNQMNLDHPRGEALHRTLLMAMAGRMRVTGWDHFHGDCRAIDEIIVKH